MKNNYLQKLIAAIRVSVTNSCNVSKEGERKHRQKYENSSIGATCTLCIYIIGKTGSSASRSCRFRDRSFGNLPIRRTYSGVSSEIRWCVRNLVNQVLEKIWCKTIPYFLKLLSQCWMQVSLFRILNS
ncbi:unnamed protein product [Acanthoscelides obtectus]|uniref:Uncharacterized protein n=1 Tax=Acanthoscelides obtectus TaxID=200917 RepID=A0A9P0P5V5_ACAOB|nr:unnamed protein product [Acanthoscelides obtectus]CAK1677176.1 hypothetical protein AOBTE_LOCUS31163 [Acanthoscelides obtectus]